MGRVPNYAKDCGNSSFILQHHKQSALERKALAFVVTAFPSIFTFIEFLVPLQCLSHETCPNAYIFSHKILRSGLYNYLRRPITDSKETTIFCFTCKTALFVVMWQQRAGQKCKKACFHCALQSSVKQRLGLSPFMHRTICGLAVMHTEFILKWLENKPEKKKTRFSFLSFVSPSKKIQLLRGFGSSFTCEVVF